MHVGPLTRLRQQAQRGWDRHQRTHISWTLRLVCRATTSLAFKVGAVVLRSDFSVRAASPKSRDRDISRLLEVQKHRRWIENVPNSLIAVALALGLPASAVACRAGQASFCEDSVYPLMKLFISAWRKRPCAEQKRELSMCRRCTVRPTACAQSRQVIASICYRRSYLARHVLCGPPDQQDMFFISKPS